MLNIVVLEIGNTSYESAHVSLQFVFIVFLKCLGNNAKIT